MFVLRDSTADELTSQSRSLDHSPKSRDRPQRTRSDERLERWDQRM